MDGTGSIAGRQLYRAAGKTVPTTTRMLCA
jgi:hypothetical protein